MHPFGVVLLLARDLLCLDPLRRGSRSDTIHMGKGEAWVGKGNFTEYHSQFVFGVKLAPMPFTCSEDKHNVCASHIRMAYAWSPPVPVQPIHACEKKLCTARNRLVFSKGIDVTTSPRLLFNQETTLVNVFSRVLGKARFVRMDHLVKHSFRGPATKCIYYKVLHFVITGNYHISTYRDTSRDPQNGRFEIRFPVPLTDGMPDVVYGAMPFALPPPKEPKEPKDFAEIYDPPEFAKE